jgi:hypothetical protein
LILFADLHVGPVVPISFDPAVDVEVERGQQAVRLSFMKDLHPLELVVMVEEKDMLSDQGDGSLVEFAV